LPPRVKKAGKLFGVGIDAGKVRPLVEVTTEAGISEVARGVTAVVLPGHDVLGLERGEDVRLGKVAVFAAASGPPADLPPGSFVHPWNLDRTSTWERSSGLQMNQREYVSHLDVVPEFLAFGVREDPFLVFPGQLVHARLVRLAKPQGEQGAGRFGGEAVLLGLDDPGPDGGFAWGGGDGLHGLSPRLFFGF
jgi:hypothetical protein